MQKFIQKLREKPEEERRHIIHISTFVCAVVLITLWSFTLSKGFKNPDLQVEVNQNLEPFKELKANVLDGYNVISDTPSIKTQ